MVKKKRSQIPAGRSRSKVGKNRFVTRSGKVIKIHRSLTERWVNKRDAKEQRKAQRLAGLPKGRFKRLIFRLHPKRVIRYWFSRDGAIMALKLTGIGIAMGFLVLVGVFAYFRKDLPNLKDISGNNIGGSVRYYDRTEQVLLWEDYEAVKRIPVSNDSISQDAKDATIAIEDKDFFNHGGFDVRGIMRAGFNNVLGKGSTQGGSTITQQLVKLTQDWTKDRTYTRKVKELILAVEMERSYTKEEILTGYLNTAPYGGIEYGIEAAAQAYFQKSAKDLNVAESAMLAAIPKSPRYYSYYSDDFDKESLIGRQHYIIDQMREQGMITAEEQEAAKAVDILAQIKPRRPKYENIKAPWFVLSAKNQLEETRGEQTVKRGGWSVTTTLDMGLQAIAEEQVTKGLDQVRKQGGDSAAFVAEDVKTGQVVALVGGADFSNPEFGELNYARTELPPGSSFKPYDYIALMETKENVGAGTVLFDTQGPIDGYPCTNKNRPKQGGNCLWDYDFRYPGPVTLRYALGGSRNVPAVKAMLMAGVDKTIQIAEGLMDPRNDTVNNGYNCFYDEELQEEGPCYASSAIGDGAYLHMDEHVHGYASISRNGLNIPQTYILKIRDANNKVIEEWEPDPGVQAIRPDSAYITAHMMEDPNASYFPAGRKPHRYKNAQGTWNFAMKTGTTNDGKDGWMMGFSTQYAAGVWVGYHSRRIAMTGTMESMTQPIWEGWMKKAHENLAPEERARPGTVKTLPAYVIRSHVGIGSVEPSPATDLFPEWYKEPTRTPGEKRTIDIVSNKVATDCTPNRARKEVDDADANTFSGDTFNGIAGNSNDKDDIHKCEDVKPSLDSLQINGANVVSTVVYAGTHPLDSETYKGTVNFISNDQIVSTVRVTQNGETVSFDASGLPGGSTVRAEVIDSVLYEGQSPNTVSTSGGSSLTLGNPGTLAASATTVDFSWSGTNSPFTIRWDLPGGSSTFVNATGCTGITGTTCTATLAGTGTYQAYVQDDNGIQSPTITFKKGN